MKYGTTLIILGVVNILVMFSGLPTGWKKFAIIAVSIIIMTIGWIFKTVAKKRKERAMEQASIIAQENREEINAIAHEIAEDVTHQVEKEISL